jgi:protein-tyrosine phosphatase
MTTEVPIDTSGHVATDMPNGETDCRRRANFRGRNRAHHRMFGTVPQVTARVLMVCAENVCTSPMAAALLRHHLARAGIDAVITSAGTEAAMRPIHLDAVRALSPWGIDLSQHVSREATEAVLVADGADLVITMCRAQLRHLVADDRRTWVRTFTLRELVREVEGTTAPRNVGFDTWAANVIRRRRGIDLVDDSQFDDIHDPAGLGSAAVHTTAAELHDLTAQLVDTLPWGQVPISATRTRG